MFQQIENIISQELKEYLISVLRKKYNWDRDESEIAIAECLKFISLALSAPQSFIQIVPELDEIWHLCILQTEEYASICEKFSPGQFLHHKSQTYDDYSNHLSTEELLEESVAWTINYISRFGDFTPKTIKFWIFPKNLCDNQGWSIQEINNLPELKNVPQQKL